MLIYDILCYNDNNRLESFEFIFIFLLVEQFSSPQFAKLSQNTSVFLPSSPMRVSFPKPAFPSHLSSMPPSCHVKALPNYGPQDIVILPSGMPVVIPTRMVVGVRVQRESIPYNRSLFHRRHTAVMDMALFHGRAFRVGWGPGNTISHCATQPLDQSEKGD